ncbi:DUF1631 family protein [Rhodoferax sp.]|uniref:DUF1631 family protein n=1 Tax=Rhodoferax sp. TaxID=50421 RepID=UPI0026355CAA|nr:DUF1631 family protein [Rhodoferax sp.]MDD2924990.1 DUF1631 family protein [Rhodoferax sp.]
MKDLSLVNSAIDFVAEFFQTTLQTNQLSTAARLTFARLQIPVLREAIATPQAFVARTHPALALIAHMGSCAAGFEGDIIPGEELEKVINDTVLFIEQSPHRGTALFELAHQKFNELLPGTGVHHDIPDKVVPETRHEKRHKTSIVYHTNLIHSMLKGLTVRPEISSFLFNVWAEVLTEATGFHGHHQETQALTKVVTDLIWASGAKKSRRSRSRTIKEVPKLLQKIRSGMNLLGLPAQTQDTHIQAISAPLIDAFLSAGPRTAPMPPATQEKPGPAGDHPSQVVPANAFHEKDMPAVEVTESQTDSVWRLFEDHVKRKATHPKPAQKLKLTIKPSTSPIPAPISKYDWPHQYYL